MTKLAATVRLAGVDSNGGKRVMIRKEMAANARVEKIAKLPNRLVSFTSGGMGGL